MKKKRILSLLLVILLITAFLSGCGSNENTGSVKNETEDASSGGNGGGDTSAKDTVVIITDADPTNFDPTKTATGATVKITRQIYDSLVEVNNDHSIEMIIAKDYSLSEDNKSYTFTLNEGILFHNGDELKASDVVFSINHAIDSPYTEAYVELVEDVRVADDYKVEVDLSSPSIVFLQNLMYIPIMNEKATTEAGDSYSDNPVGSGPYRFVSYKSGSEVTLTRFDDYFRGPASIKNVVYRIIPDYNTATVSLLAGESDYGRISMTSYEQVASSPNLVLNEWQSNMINFFIVNHEVEPFNNKLVRQALNYALDREFALEAEAEGQGAISAVMLPENVIGYSNAIEKNYIYDPEKARELLEQAGITTPLHIGTISVLDSMGIGAAEVFMGGLKDIGLEADIQILEKNKYFEELDSGDFQIASSDWSGIDADEYSMLYLTSQIDSLNSARYSNPELDRLHNLAKITLDNKEREKLYAEIYNIINEDAVYIPVYTRKEVYAHNKNLNVKINKLWHESVYDMYWE